jgi:DNA-binding beta-propeller fold protein YncE
MSEKNSICVSGLALGVLLACAATAVAQQQSAPSGDLPLILTTTIPLPNVEGRIDHFAIDPAGRVFVCVIGNNTVEVLETLTEKRVHTITGVPHPQGVVFASDVNKLFVASRDGQLYIYNGTSLDLIASIDFHGDVDNLRYDAAAKRVYVGYGDEENAAIGMVDAATDKRLEEEFKMGAHPESFQLESSGSHIFVNLPDLKQIAAIDRKTGAISKWPMANLEGNFPMALDEANHRMFVATRTPPRLVVLDTASGAVVAILNCAADSDDLYYDALYKRIYVPGGQGRISVFAQNDSSHYQLLAEIPSELGARTAAYAAKIGKKGRDRLFVGVPGRAGHGAEVWIYQAQE